MRFFSEVGVEHKHLAEKREKGVTGPHFCRHPLSPLSTESRPGDHDYVQMFYSALTVSYIISEVQYRKVSCCCRAFFF